MLSIIWKIVAPFQSQKAGNSPVGKTYHAYNAQYLNALSKEQDGQDVINGDTLECTHINKKGAVFKITARASGEFDPEQEIQTPYNRRLSTGSYGLVRLYSANNFKSETSQMREIPYQKEF